MSEEMKIVINLKGESATVGISKPDCDPFFSKVDGELPAVLKTLPKLVKQALTRWETNPKHPKCETDLTPPAPARVAKTAPKTKAKPAQPVMF